MGEILDIGSIVGAIELDDNLTPAVERAADKLLEAGRAVTEFGRSVTMASEHAKRGGGIIEGSLKTVGIVAAGALGAIVALGTGIAGIATHGSKLLGVEGAFDRLAESAGIAGEAVAESLNRGLKGTVDSMDQFQSMNTLLSSRMKLTAENAQLLGAAARAIGKATGGDATSGLNSLTSALQRGNDRALRAVGIRVDLQKAERTYADAIGTTADKLSEVGKIEAHRQGILEELRKYMDSVGESELSFAEMITKARLAVSDFFDDIAKAVASSPAVMGAINAIADGIAQIGGSASAVFGDVRQTAIDAIVNGINAFSDAVAASVPYVVAVAQKVRDFWNWLVQLNEKYQITATVAKIARAAFEFLKEALVFVTTAASKMVDVWSAMPKWLQDVAKYSTAAGISLYALGRGAEAAADPFNDLLHTVDTWINVVTNTMASSHMLIDSLDALADRGGLFGGVVGKMGTGLSTLIAPLATMAGLASKNKIEIAKLSDEALDAAASFRNVSDVLTKGVLEREELLAASFGDLATTMNMEAAAATTASEATTAAGLSIGALAGPVLLVTSAITALAIAIHSVSDFSWGESFIAAIVPPLGMAMKAWKDMKEQWKDASKQAQEFGRITDDYVTVSIYHSKEAFAGLTKSVTDWVAKAVKGVRDVGRAIADDLINKSDFVQWLKSVKVSWDDIHVALRASIPGLSAFEAGVDKITEAWKRAKLWANLAIIALHDEAERIRREQADKTTGGVLPPVTSGVGTVGAQIDPKSMFPTPSKEDTRDLTTYRLEVEALLKDLAGVKATQDLGVLIGAWNKLPPSLKANQVVIDDVLQRFTALASQARNIPASLAPGMKALGDMAERAGMFALPFERGIKSAEGLGQVVFDTIGSNVGLTTAQWEAMARAEDQAFKEGQRITTLEKPIVAAFSAGAAGVLAFGATVKTAHLETRALAVETQVRFQQMGENVAEAFNSAFSAVHTEKIEADLDRLIARDREMNDFIMKGALDSASYRVYQAVRAGEIEREQQRLTGENAQASLDRQMIAIAEIIREQDNWKGSLKTVSAQLHKMGVDIPEDKLRELIQGMVDFGKTVPEITTVGEAFDAIGKKLGGLGSAFQQLAQVAGDSLADIVRSIGTMASSASMVIENARGIGKAFTEIGTAKQKGSITGMITGFASMATSIIGAAAAAIQFGKALYDAIVKPDWKKAIDEISRTWQGVGKISENVAKQIEEDQKSIFAGMRNNRWAAEVYNLGKIIDDVSLSSKNFTGLIKELRQAFVFLAEGTFTAEQAVTVLDQSFGKFVEFLGGNVTPELKEIIHLTKEYGLTSKAVTDYIDEQAKKAGDALRDTILGRGAVLDALKEAQSKLDDLVKHHGSADDIAKAKLELEKLTKQLAALPLTGSGAVAFGSALLGIFQQLAQDGADPLALMEEWGPAIESLRAQLEYAGLSGGTAFDSLYSSMKLATDEVAGPALKAIRNYGVALEGLNNADMLTPESFKGITDQVTATIEALKKQGKTMDEMYPYVQDSLQTIWELQHDYGYEVDATTQALLDQAEADGKVGEKHRSVQEQMLRATQLMTDAIVFMATQLGYTVPANLDTAAGAYTEFADGAIDDINRIPTSGSYDVYGKYHPPDMPDNEAPEGPPAPPYATGGIVEPVYAWRGIFVPRGTDTVPAMLTPGEGVVNLAGMSRLGKLALDALNGSAPLAPGVSARERTPEDLRGDRGGGDSLTIVIQALDSKTVKEVVERDIAPTLNDVWRRNSRATRTDARRALGV